MKTKLLPFVLIIFSLFTFFSCASKQKVQRERSETFIADLEPFYIGEQHLYTRLTIAAPKISDFEITFMPRSNYIIVKAKMGLDVIKIGFPYSERKKLYEVANQYLDMYNAGQIKDEKPTKKNALLKSSLQVAWGVLGYSHDITASYMVNIEYLEENKPYFRMKFDAITDPEDGSTSPAFSIYISPSQWQSIFEMCDQASLEAQCDEIIAQAEAF